MRCAQLCALLVYLKPFFFVCIHVGCCTGLVEHLLVEYLLEHMVHMHHVLDYVLGWYQFQSVCIHVRYRARITACMYVHIVIRTYVCVFIYVDTVHTRAQTHGTYSSHCKSYFIYLEISLL